MHPNQKLGYYLHFIVVVSYKISTATAINALINGYCCLVNTLIVD